MGGASRRQVLGSGVAVSALLATPVWAQAPSADRAAARAAYMSLFGLAEAGNVREIERLIRRHNLSRLPMANVALALACNVAGDPLRAMEIVRPLNVLDIGERKVQVYAGAAERLARQGKLRDADEAAAAASAAADEIIGEGLDVAVAGEALEQLSPAVQLRSFIAIRQGEPLRAFEHSEAGRARLLGFALKDDALPQAHRVEIARMRRELSVARSSIRIAVLESYIAGERARGRAAAASVRTPVVSRRASAAVLAVASPAGGGLTVVPLAGGGAARAAEVAGVLELPRLFETNAPAGGQSWKRAVDGRRARALRANSQDMAWLRDLNALSDSLWLHLGRDFTGALGDFDSGARVVWLPTAKLGLLPLAIARNPENGRYLIDDFELVQAPSWSAYAQAEARVNADARPTAIGAAFNPTGDLTFAGVEGDMIGAIAKERLVARVGAGAGAKDSFARIAGATVWHFATHASFDLTDARKAAIYFAPDASGAFTTLTMGDVLDLGAETGPRLVFLSACESGLSEVARTPEEFVGLPSAFLQAGAAAVIATLWKVDDLPTALISARFYEMWLGRGVDPATALRAAQIWLRDSDSATLRAYVAGLSLPPDSVAAVEQALAALPPDAPPFAHPHYWGPFVYVGA